MPDRLQEIRARLATATPGPWVVIYDDVVWSCDNGDGKHECVVPELGDTKTENVALIENAPADIAWLLDEVERLRHTKASSANPLCDEPAKQGVTKRERPDAK